ncbi:MAG: Rieske 2Fe-2S domain-containing protein [Chloroflexi bacterium]|nr:Rieske 2Fe-2S domain-containing protein [Chloroflexota bacterium]MBI3763143.1 Rieske 2Fe-2S domain-containing protein [Chloroflexota bacterium]
MSEAVTTAPPKVQTVPMTRREFLYYIWGASMALLSAESVGAIIWFAIPRFKAGEFGGVFTLALSELPEVDSGPKAYPDGRFWLVSLGDKTVSDPRQPKDYPVRKGVQAIYKVCVHLGCLYKWVPTNNRFECPCHGSKYLLNGVRIDGPARRNLDMLVTQIVDANGKVLAETKTGDTNRDDTAGAPLEIPPGAAAIKVNTGKRVVGANNSKPGGGK